MKYTTITCLFLFLALFTLSAQVEKRCKLDKRAFSERRADYGRVLQYPSGFEDYNGKDGGEHLLFNDQSFVVNYSPLCDFKNITQSLVGDVMPITKEIKSEKCPNYMKKVVSGSFFKQHGSRRGFMGSWIINDNKLYLQNIRLGTADSWLFRHSDIKIFINKQIRAEVVNLPAEKLYKRVEKATGRKFNTDSLLFADWFTGTLLGETDYQGSDIPFRTLFIYIEKGVVKASEIRDCEPLAPEFHESVYFFERSERSFADPHYYYEGWYKIEKGTPNTKIRLPILEDQSETYEK